MMERKLLINKFDNLLKIQNEDTLRVNLYGYLTEIILSKDLFKNNIDLIVFFECVGISHKKYVYASRTLLLAKTIRNIQIRDIKQLIELRNKTMGFLEEKIESQPDRDEKTKYDKSKVDPTNDDYVKGILKKYNRSNK